MIPEGDKGQQRDAKPERQRVSKASVIAVVVAGGLAGIFGVIFERRARRVKSSR